MEANVKWVSGSAFESRLDGHTVTMDLSPEGGGEDRGPRPKGLLLTALGGCSGLDVVAILEKMRVPVTGFEMQLSADQTEGQPKVFKGIHVKYVFSGPDLPMAKLKRAVDLSQERYCGVSAMLAKACPVTYEIVVRD